MHTAGCIHGEPKKRKLGYLLVPWAIFSRNADSRTLARNNDQFSGPVSRSRSCTVGLSARVSFMKVFCFFPWRDHCAPSEPFIENIGCPKWTTGQSSIKVSKPFVDTAGKHNFLLEIHAVCGCYPIHARYFWRRDGLFRKAIFTVKYREALTLYTGTIVSLTVPIN